MVQLDSACSLPLKLLVTRSPATKTWLLSCGVLPGWVTSALLRARVYPVSATGPSPASLWETPVPLLYCKEFSAVNCQSTQLLRRLGHNYKGNCSVSFLMPLLWICMYNPTKDSGLADRFVIINDKFAETECLTVVTLYVFLRDAERLGMTCSGIK